MHITRQKQGADSDKWLDWHILTVAEAGFSMLDIYGRHKHHVAIETIKKFADQINNREESGSLYPIAPISAVPRSFFRSVAEEDIPEHLDKFKQHIGEFIEANRKTIRARKILIDFHVSPKPVSEFYLATTEDVFREKVNDDEIDEIVLFT